MPFKTPDGKVFETRNEWRDYMMLTFYSFKNKKNEINPLIKEPGSIDGQMFDISDCENSTLIIMDNTEQIQIDDTKNCRIFIGACTSSIFIRNCTNCTFYTCCRQLRLRDCTDCKFYIYSMSEVHIEYSTKLSFAPFNGGYPDHAKHLSIARLDPQHNLWYDVYDHNDPSKTRFNWSLIDPETYEEPWFPAGPCEPAIPRTLPGSVKRVDDDSSMLSFDINQMKAHAAELKNASSAPPLPTPTSSIETSQPQSQSQPSSESSSTSSSSPRVAIIGRGDVGITLGRRFVQAGWSVQFGSRNPEETRSKSKPDEILSTSPIVSISDAVNWSQFVVLTVPGMRSLEEYTALATLLGDGIKGKVVIDTTNPLSFPGFEVFWDGNTSAGERIQNVLPDSYVFKAFNTVGLNQLGNPNGELIPGRNVNQGPLKMLFCGPTEQRDIASQIISAVGFNPTYVGSIRYSRNLEAIAELWIHLAIPGVGSSENWGMGFHFEPTGI